MIACISASTIGNILGFIVLACVLPISGIFFIWQCIQVIRDK